MATSYTTQHFEQFTPEQLAQSTAADIYATVAPVTALATIAVILRLISRRKSRTSLSYDDYLIILALIFVYGLNTTTILQAALYGLGRHLVTVLPLLVGFQKAGLANFVFYFTSQAMTKASLLALYYRLFGINKRFRCAIHISFAIIGAWYICVLFAGIFQCRPIAAFWNRNILNAQCVNLVHFSVATAITNLLTDVLVLCVPMPMIWSLQLTKEQKWSLTGIFALGFFVCTMSIIRITYLVKVTGQDFTWTLVNAFVWTSIEPSIGVVSACLPTLRPLFGRYLGASFARSVAGPSTRNKASSGKVSVITSAPSSKGTWSPASNKGAGQGHWKRLDEEAFISITSTHEDLMAKPLHREPVNFQRQIRQPSSEDDAGEMKDVELGELAVEGRPIGTTAAGGHVDHHLASLRIQAGQEVQLSTAVE